MFGFDKAYIEATPQFLGFAFPAKNRVIRHSSKVRLHRERAGLCLPGPLCHRFDSPFFRGLYAGFAFLCSSILECVHINLAAGQGLQREKMICRQKRLCQNSECISRLNLLKYSI